MKGKYLDWNILTEITQGTYSLRRVYGKLEVQNNICCSHVSVKGNILKKKILYPLSSYFELNLELTL